MIRIILALALIVAAAFGVAWLAGQSGSVALSWSGSRIVTSVPMFLLGLAVVVIAVMSIVALVRALLSKPAP